MPILAWQVFHASPKLAAVGSVDEAVVIGAALSLSSSAFVLQLMSERGELATKFGSATLGILLLQVGLAGSCIAQTVAQARVQLLSSRTCYASQRGTPLNHGARFAWMSAYIS
jgi:Kef-type K+ transport system membrane component KefB